MPIDALAHDVNVAVLMLDAVRDPTDEEVVAHHANCRMCLALHRYARANGDHAVLQAWQRQFREHLGNERAFSEPEPVMRAEPE